ncbi:MAG: D-2-hydroxyacid dehydrogenase [Saprospiraceae bacterium]|nr:D-2-hydroxyacid dehydrogenase [Saprospiraceae bacterium]MCB0543090.1 D-2-hydroxyacid dehydrogenase [Saprospiraceae bacterium]MCB0574639.1 D-2-hydroxyacid dehydrogenase [Saprospiraceae bacterium]MCB9307021.1 D-2-hydroxyacid dehydrogenase [Lewinellaceae bacterium]MCB9355908.1 D-2-hydroxyacid dehydrogenase [Lewinellaceae bacterium]
MIKILVNDGIHPDGRLLLEEAAYVVDEERVPQDALADRIAEYDVLIVRSATKVTKAVIDSGKNLKIIARGGVGLDNIDVEYAQSKGIQVFNTPMASSRAVAELAIAHLFALSRKLNRSNRELPSGGDFKKLKKAYETGFQIKGKTLGVLGFGRIGQEVAKIALGLGMSVKAHDPFVQEAEVGIQLNDFSDLRFCVKIRTESFEKVIRESDFITIHIPGGGQPVITAEEMEKMKDGVFLINTARGGVIDEEALLNALETGKVGAAGLDVYENEPNPREALLKHPNVSCSPHIGASTVEAQSYIGMELADKIIAFFGDDK